MRSVPPLCVLEARYVTFLYAWSMLIGLYRADGIVDAAEVDEMVVMLRDRETRRPAV